MLPTVNHLLHIIDKLDSIVLRLAASPASNLAPELIAQIAQLHAVYDRLNEIARVYRVTLVRRDEPDAQPEFKIGFLRAANATDAQHLAEIAAQQWSRGAKWRLLDVTIQGDWETGTGLHDRRVLWA